MYSTELMSVYDEWKDKKYVGLLSYKLSKRLSIEGFLLYPRSLDDYDTFIRNANPDIHTVCGFMCYNHSYADSVPLLKGVLYDTCKKIGFDLNYHKFIIGSIRHEKRNFLNNIAFPFHNYWMTTPSYMLSYITFFNNVWMPALESHPDIWSNPEYNYSIHREVESGNQRMLRITNGKVDYIPLHAFANERLPRIFFTKMNNLHIYATDGTLIPKPVY